MFSWLRDLFRRYEPPGRPTTESDRLFNAEMERRRREEQDYRLRFGPLVNRGQSMADSLSRALPLPAGVSVVFDDSELRTAHQRLREHEERERMGWA